jgi:hypothetical protein
MAAYVHFVRKTHSKSKKALLFVLFVPHIQSQLQAHQNAIASLGSQVRLVDRAKRARKESLRIQSGVLRVRIAYQIHILMWQANPSTAVLATLDTLGSTAVLLVQRVLPGHTKHFQEKPRAYRALSTRTRLQQACSAHAMLGITGK